ncbi:MAG TPA: hypothetical protein VNO81_08435 [Candidatus Nitrosotenuis sp.]|jgi:hypothetical protein|nr:hypothetical protein [Candidatus Nitrosotenuis sp.]
MARRNKVRLGDVLDNLLVNESPATPIRGEELKVCLRSILERYQYEEVSLYSEILDDPTAEGQVARRGFYVTSELSLEDQPLQEIQEPTVVADMVPPGGHPRFPVAGELSLGFGPLEEVRVGRPEAPVEEGRFGPVLELDFSAENLDEVRVSRPPREQPADSLAPGATGWHVWKGAFEREGDSWLSQVPSPLPERLVG